MTEKCRVCQQPSDVVLFTEHILNEDVTFSECRYCSYVQTQLPTWLELAYKSVINHCDTGILLRNQINIGVVLASLSIIGKRGGRVIDCAGGYGILVRLLRDRGIEALWSDPYCTNLMAVGFEYAGEQADLVTAFEAFEHFVDPIMEMESLLSVGPNLLISTTLIPQPSPSADAWWYYGINHGQHVGFFRKKTLDFLAHKFKKSLTTDGQCYHLFSEHPVSAAKWRLTTRIARRFPSLFTYALRSKTWSDFEKMSNLQ